MSIWSQINNLFSQMGILPAILLSLGLIVCFIEIVNPEYGLFALIGGVTYLFGMIVRLLNGGTLAMAFVLIFVFCVFLVASYLINVRLTRYNLILRTPALEMTEEFADLDDGKDYYFLLGLEGVADGVMDPQGRILINNTSIKAMSKNGGIIESGTRVRVVEVEGSKILVKEIYQ